MYNLPRSDVRTCDKFRHILRIILEALQFGRYDMLSTRANKKLFVVLIANNTKACRQYCRTDSLAISR